MEEKTEYIDSHAHLASAEFDEERQTLTQKLLDTGIKHVCLITLHPQECEKAFCMQKEHPTLFQVAYGIFPEDLSKRKPEDWQQLETIAQDPRISAIGEIGLDYHWQPEEKELQKEAFIRQIELANQVQKPILIHSRDAMQDTYEILKEHRPTGFLMHCYSGSVEMAKELIKLGGMISLGGPVTFKNARHAKEVATQIDAKYLLSETDSPYMAPEPVRGTKNDPTNIPYIVREIARLKEMPESELAKILLENYQTFMGISHV